MAKDHDKPPTSSTRSANEVLVDAMVVIYQLSTIVGITIEDATTVYLKVSARLSAPKAN